MPSGSSTKIGGRLSSEAEQELVGWGLRAHTLGWIHRPPPLDQFQQTQILKYINQINCSDCQSLWSPFGVWTPICPFPTGWSRCLYPVADQGWGKSSISQSMRSLSISISEITFNHHLAIYNGNCSALLLNYHPANHTFVLHITLVPAAVLLNPLHPRYIYRDYHA